MGGKTLIVLPLGVKQEFVRDAEDILHIKKTQYITCMAEENAENPDVITLFDLENSDEGE